MNRKSFTLLSFMTALSGMALSGCQAIGGIFKAGMWVGVVVAGLIVALGFGAARAIRK